MLDEKSIGDFETIDYAFKIEKDSAVDSVNLIDFFLEKEGLNISQEDKECLTNSYLDLVSLRRTLVELRDRAMLKKENTVDINWLNNNFLNGISIDFVDNISDGYEFERFSAELLRKNGFYDISVTKMSCDFGVDILATKDEIKYAIQCKHYSSLVGIDAVQQVLGSKTMYDCHVGVVLTNNDFTPEAQKLAQKNNVLLWNRQKLIALLN